MSVLIKDMEMPKDCATCHFCHTEYFRAWCCITGEDIEITDMTAVQEDCPLSEAPEPCEDAASRKAAIEAVIDLCKHYTPTKSVNHPHMDFVIEVLQDLPPVTPKRKKGKWIEEQRGIKVTQYKCSECGRTVMDDTGYDVTKDYPFCHCGADMGQRGRVIDGILT